MEEFLHRIKDFLAVNDLPTIIESARKLQLGQVARSPYTWFIILPLLVYMMWTKKFKLIFLFASFIAFLALIQKTLTASAETLRLEDMLMFVGGAIALVGLNYYFLFVRD